MNIKFRNFSFGLLLTFFSAAYFSKIVGGEVQGTDEKAIEVIQEIQTGYKPWFRPIWSPPKEVENLIFTLQAALGAAAIGYGLGYLRGKRSK